MEAVVSGEWLKWVGDHLFISTTSGLGSPPGEGGRGTLMTNFGVQLHLMWTIPARICFTGPRVVGAVGLLSLTRLRQ